MWTEDILAQPGCGNSAPSVEDNAHIPTYYHQNCKQRLPVFKTLHYWHGLFVCQDSSSVVISPFLFTAEWYSVHWMPSGSGSGSGSGNDAKYRAAPPFKLNINSEAGTVHHDRDIDIKRHAVRLYLKSFLSSWLYKEPRCLRNLIEACSLPIESACLGLHNPERFVHCHQNPPRDKIACRT